MLPTDNPTNNRWTVVPDTLPLLLTASEAAGLMGCTSKHVRELVKKGELKGAKLGGTWRVNRDALLKLCGLS